MHFSCLVCSSLLWLPKLIKTVSFEKQGLPRKSLMRLIPQKSGNWLFKQTRGETFQTCLSLWPLPQAPSAVLLLVLWRRTLESKCSEGCLSIDCPQRPPKGCVIQAPRSSFNGAMASKTSCAGQDDALKKVSPFDA